MKSQPIGMRLGLMQPQANRCTCKERAVVTLFFLRAFRSVGESCYTKLGITTGWGCCLLSCSLTMTTAASCLWEQAPGESTAARERKMNEWMKCAVSRTRPCQQTNEMRVTLFRSGTGISGIHLQLPKGTRCKHCALAGTGIPGASVLLHMGELRYKMRRLGDSN